MPLDRATEFQAALVKGHRVNDVLHLILTVVTFGLWGIVWIILAISTPSACHTAWRRCPECGVDFASIGQPVR